MIYRKVYVSDMSPDVGQKDVEQILMASRRNNAVANLSGLLVSDGRRFFQVLEGPLDALEACYARIEADTRHRRVHLLAKGTAPERAFGNWQMGHANPAELQPLVRDSVFELTRLLDAQAPERGDNARVHGLLETFLAAAMAGSLVSQTGSPVVGT
ncbi:BLUF domain-containing protein [Sulfitobacter sp. M57]|uniref:BLUF domain-containing protein n=1 Tax=unclassified Sulfitobacter TaxID=196795 RepID=UPI0023E2F9A8|nr:MULTISPECIES: BLUF domain-containing protein [unclassified Sulfitobacter]MDF3414146.1 BLUF domain-containing protein [Sulfitobacter sp. KE5]MDF3420573.1 BLUF domain-containing protein [Sulfitobacter sp. KE43]MDF3432692.1 BLUF domain-containing protein [Sulfitobacter sp. KE42]MDF3458331.1 BLUF domain-containing protein [Sulfitobacter sp. S74]MDF3462232.1 BLUF domain-containing protein [Sulfitobacter sp. Ks18]